MIPVSATPSLARTPLFDRLAGAQRVLVAGAGGGFDVYAGVPLFAALLAAGKSAFLANLTFTYLGGTDAEPVTHGLHRVGPTTTGEDRYFPERYLAEWLATKGWPSDVYCFEKLGVRHVRAAYRALVDRLDVDAVVLVDGGTDILMRGDEAGLGTPQEDMVSLASVAALDDVPSRLVACVGFGIDAFHGVCHAHFLENVAALDADGAFLGAVSLLRSMPEGEAFASAVEHAHARMPARQSIVNGSILSALEGRFGNHHRTSRTQDSELFINPLMCLYWGFDLPAVANRSLYLPMLADTETIFEVSARIEAFRHGVAKRPRTTIPG
jgi:hypothetical protein